LAKSEKKKRLRFRDALKLSPGQKLQVVVYGNRIEMIPLKRISEMKGFLKGIGDVQYIAKKNG